MITSGQNYNVDVLIDSPTDTYFRVLITLLRCEVGTLVVPGVAEGVDSNSEVVHTSPAAVQCDGLGNRAHSLQIAG